MLFLLFDVRATAIDRQFHNLKMSAQSFNFWKTVYLEEKKDVDFLKFCSFFHETRLYLQIISESFAEIQIVLVAFLVS